MPEARYDEDRKLACVLESPLVRSRRYILNNENALILLVTCPKPFDFEIKIIKPVVFYPLAPNIDLSMKLKCNIGYK